MSIRNGRISASERPATVIVAFSFQLVGGVPPTVMAPHCNAEGYCGQVLSAMAGRFWNHVGDLGSAAAPAVAAAGAAGLDGPGTGRPARGKPPDAAPRHGQAAWPRLPGGRHAGHGRRLPAPRGGGAGPPPSPRRGNPPPSPPPPPPPP